MSEKSRQPPLHVVVDGGIDDALALAVLIGAGTSVAQVIATEGSRPLGQTALTTARILFSFASTIPLRLGVASGLSGPYPQGRDPFHGDDCFAGLCDTLGAADQPEESWEPLDGPVLAAGALTVPAVAVAAGWGCPSRRSLRRPMDPSARSSRSSSPPAAPRHARSSAGSRPARACWRTWRASSPDGQTHASARARTRLHLPTGALVEE